MEDERKPPYHIPTCGGGRDAVYFWGLAKRVAGPGLKGFPVMQFTGREDILRLMYGKSRAGSGVLPLVFHLKNEGNVKKKKVDEPDDIVCSFQVIR